MKMKARLCMPFSMVALTICIMGCTSNGKKTTNDVASVEVVPEEQNDGCCGITTENYFGTYEGVLPCADCGGKKTILSILEDGTYHLEYEYLDKGEGVIEENGVYYLYNDSLIQTVTPSSGDKTYYSIQAGAIVLCDSLGTVSEGSLKDLYVLKKVSPEIEIGMEYVHGMNEEPDTII